MTDEELIALRDAATPGPWLVVGPTDCVMAGYMHVAQVRGWGWLTGHGSDGPRLTDYEALQVQKANARLIAATPDLIDEVLRLRAKVDALEEALEFYTDLSHEGPWHLPGEDYGKRARAALTAWEATTKGERK